MKISKLLIPLQALLSLISGILVAQMSWLGRVGIDLLHKDYSIFKSWWQTAIAFFVIQIILDIIQFIIKKRSAKSGLFIGIILILGLLGLYATFHDFTTNFSHKILKEKSHTGFYLFWLTWIGSSIYFMFAPKKVQ